MVHLQLNRQASLTVTDYKQKKCTVSCKYVADLCVCVCAVSSFGWVEHLATCQHTSSFVFIVAITVFSSITLVVHGDLKQLTQRQMGVFLLNTPLQPLVLQWLCTSSNLRFLLGHIATFVLYWTRQTSHFAFLCLFVSLWSKNRILINVLVELNLYKNKLALNSERLANRIIGSALLML